MLAVSMDVTDNKTLRQMKGLQGAIAVTTRKSESVRQDRLFPLPISIGCRTSSSGTRRKGSDYLVEFQEDAYS